MEVCCGNEIIIETNSIKYDSDHHLIVENGNLITVFKDYITSPPSKIIEIQLNHNDNNSIFYDKWLGNY